VKRKSAGSDRIVYAIGHYRNGVLLAPLTAHVVAEWVPDGKKDLSPGPPVKRKPPTTASKGQAGA
jgi:glycine/D-amino acid oxidase-like deaminating enzyme